MPRVNFMLVIAAVVAGLALGFLGALTASRLGMKSEASTSVPAVAAPLPEKYAAPRDSSVPEGEEASVTPVPVEEETALPVMVSICGAVKRAGTFRFEEDKRVNDAIRAAGGLLPEADLDDINIAARLMDNTTLYIPFSVFSEQDGRALVARRTPTAAEMNPGRYTRSGWTGVTAEPVMAMFEAQPPPEIAPAASALYAAQPSPSGGLIDLNLASLQELQELPGIGPKTAEKIIAYRESTPFQRVDDLMEVHGIGEKKMEAVKNLVTVGQAASP